MPTLLWTATRIANGLRKVAAGLTPFGESVWPGVRNDLFLAHRSIYRFFSTFAGGRRVLDAGCGTGYGSHLLATSGSSYVLGVDVDTRSIRFARRHYSEENLEYRVADCQALRPVGPRFDLIVASNMLEHLEQPSAFLRAAVDALTEDGQLVIALPPILAESDLEAHKNIHYHRANLTVDGWLVLFGSFFEEVKLYRHSYEGDDTIDFASPFRSRLDESAFSFAPASRDGLYARAPITVVFLVERPA
jgi:SAM-dependent methyltransferase